MSTIYLIAFDRNKALKKTEYYYKDIFENKELVLDKDEGIFFSKELSPEEQEIATKMFQQRKIYAIRCGVPLGYCMADKDVDERYYMREKEQLAWFVDFLKKHISSYDDVLFLAIPLVRPKNSPMILSIHLDVNDIVLEDEFAFEEHIYQFVNNKG